MAMKVLRFDDVGAMGFEIDVHLDDTKMKDGAPDPDWVRSYSWGSWEVSQLQGETKAQYRQRIRAETKGIAKADLERVRPTRNSVTALLGDL